MAPYIAFLTEHWMLSVAFIAILVLLLFNEWRHRSYGIAGVSPQQLVDLLNHSGAAVVDIRPSARYDQGHILGSINLPKEELEKRLNMLSKYKNKPVILVCTAGIESGKMGRLLSANGFAQLYHLTGGMDMWRSQSMPVVKKS